MSTIEYEKKIEILHRNLSKKTSFAQISLIYGRWKSNIRLSEFSGHLIEYRMDEEGISELTDIISIPLQKIKFVNISYDDLTVTMITQNIRPSDENYHLYEFTCDRELTRLSGTYDGKTTLIWERI